MYDENFVQFYKTKSIEYERIRQIIKENKELATREAEAARIRKECQDQGKLVQPEAPGGDSGSKSQKKKKQP